ncbi:MAG: transposase [Syntrophothermus sp.]|uniref:transposase n=1 Tax=Syntrophothermus sp. TaxID=2736299 RepID=UPI00257D2784|nr:transposase [Syntrophothermus sp.]NSW84627.1 transposase [Syntrophothermus sp.]
MFLALASIDVEPIKKMFPAYKGVGRHGYSRVALFRSLVLQKIVQLPGIEALVRCLKYSPQIAYWCGFDTRKPLPSATVFYRFLGELKEKAGQELLDQVAEKMITRVAKRTSSEGMVVIDNTDIPPRERPKNEQPGSAWGHRTASEEETELFYGYKFHAAVLLTDIGSLPLAGRLAPANVADVELAPVLIDEACRQHQLIYGFRPEYYLMDAGYDSSDIYKKAINLKAQAIIKLNRRNQKKPPEGFDENDTPLCPAGQAMVFWGSDRKQLTIKFRCPKAVGQQAGRMSKRVQFKQLLWAGGQVKDNRKPPFVLLPPSGEREMAEDI